MSLYDLYKQSNSNETLQEFFKKFLKAALTKEDQSLRTQEENKIKIEKEFMKSRLNNDLQSGIIRQACEDALKRMNIIN